jgi:tRNA threonylcarbamoyladenosine biosynthesis protein TsaE
MNPILDEHSLEFVSRSATQTQRLGARLGALLRGGDVICLEGALGAGKTCLAQGIGRGWGVGQPLISPTFVLIREYTRPQTKEEQKQIRLYHIDLYRISGVEEAWSLGIDDFMGASHAICIIEWAERARSLIPPDHLWIQLDFASYSKQTQRALHISASGARHQALLHAFRQAAFGA